LLDALVFLLCIKTVCHLNLDFSDKQKDTIGSQLTEYVYLKQMLLHVQRV